MPTPKCLNSDSSPYQAGRAKLVSDGRLSVANAGGLRDYDEYERVFRLPCKAGSSRQELAKAHSHGGMALIHTNSLVIICDALLTIETSKVAFLGRD